jgi:hypothetical protein
MMNLDPRRPLIGLPRVFGVALSALAVGVAACGGHGTRSAAGSGAQTGSSSSVSGASSASSGGPGGSGTGGAGAGGTSGTGGGAPLKGTPIGGFTGVNGLIVDDPANLAPLGWVREYHNWGWICDNYAAGPAYPGMLYTFMNFNGWDWDVFFSMLKAQGVMGFPAVQGSVPWMNGSAIPPVLANADKTLAASYVAHADTMFQIAARYGSVKVPDAELKLKANQTRVSGLGTVTYFENFNEEDNAAAFTPDAMAAMCSADYDGDQMRLGTTFGVKNADPSARLVMGGLSGAYPTPKWQASILAYLDGMRAWAAAHRAGDFPADVVNVHYYSFNTTSGQPALSPEDDHVKDKLAAVVSYRNQNLLGKEVWWTEFGYDTYSRRLRWRRPRSARTRRSSSKGSGSCAPSSRRSLQGSTARRSSSSTTRASSRVRPACRRSSSPPRGSSTATASRSPRGTSSPRSARASRPWSIRGSRPQGRTTCRSTPSRTPAALAARSSFGVQRARPTSSRATSSPFPAPPRRPTPSR